MVQRKLFTTNFTTIDRKRETAEQLRPRIFLVEYILTCKIFHDLFAVYRDNNAIKKVILMKQNLRKRRLMVKKN